MSPRNKLHDRVAPLLEPGEQIQEVMLSQTGPNPNWALITFWAYFRMKHRFIVATDRAVVVIAAGPAGASAKEVLARLPRTTRIGPVSGLYSRIELAGETQWIHKRFHGHVGRADALAAPQPERSEPSDG